jgi:hypothetical protein
MSDVYKEKIDAIKAQMDELTQALHNDPRQLQLVKLHEEFNAIYYEYLRELEFEGCIRVIRLGHYVNDKLVVMNGSHRTINDANLPRLAEYFNVRYVKAHHVVDPNANDWRQDTGYTWLELGPKKLL